MPRKVTRVRMVLLWMAVIFAFSATPDLQVTQLGNVFTKSHRYLIDVAHIQWDLVFSLRNPFFDIPTNLYVDFWLHKAGHCLVFSVLGLLCYRATRRVLPSLMICAGYAFLDELHQAFVPGRSSRLTDVLLDTVIAYLFIRLWHAYNRPDRAQKNAHTKKPVPR